MGNACSNQDNVQQKPKPQQVPERKPPADGPSSPAAPTEATAAAQEQQYTAQAAAVPPREQPQEVLAAEPAAVAPPVASQPSPPAATIPADPQPQSPAKPQTQPQREEPEATHAPIDIEIEHEPGDIESKTSVEEEQPDSDVDDWCVRGREIQLRNLENADAVKEDKEFGVDAADDLFATAESSEGKCFMAVQPWKGAIMQPSNPPPHNPSPPDMRLEMEWVYGYRGFDAHNNVCISSDGGLVYPAAAVCVKYNSKQHTQAFFHGHNDDVICLAQSPSNPDLIATGQVATIVNRKATLPHICVWDAKTMQSLQTIPNAAKRAVRCLAFSPSGKYLAAVGDDNDQTMTIWDWQTGSKLASSPTDDAPRKIFCVRWRSEDELVTAGNKHLYCWSFDSGSLSKKRMLLKGRYRLQTFFDAVFTKKGYCAVACRDGSLFIFDKHGSYYKCVFGVKEHTGSVFGVCLRDNGGLVTGGKDNKVVIWSNRLKVEQVYNVNAAARAVYARAGSLLVGTDQCELLEVRDYELKAAPELRVSGHSDGELWALDYNPKSSGEFATAGEDNKVALWDANEHRLIKAAEISAKPGERRKRTRAATTSSQPANRCARAAVYSPDGGHLAIGTNDGELAVFDTNQMTQVVLHNLNDFAKQNVQNKEGNWIQCMKYSPDGSVLAVGTHGSVIVLCDVKNGYEPAGKLGAHNAALTHLDFSSDGLHIQSACRAYELLYHDVKQPLGDSEQNPSGASELKDCKWATQTAILGWGVQGIFDPQQDGTDVNCVDLSPDGQVLATGDDYGYVNLFRYPVLTNCEHSIVTGHASHVMNVKFSPDQKRLFSVGGGDKTIIQWLVR